MAIPQKLPVSDNVPISEIVKSLNAVIDGFFSKLFMYAFTSEPSIKIANMIVMADGTNWNPGSGAGLYRYDGSTWVFIG